MNLSFLLLFPLILPLALAFQSPSPNAFNHRHMLILSLADDDDNSSNGERKKSELDELTPPSISFTRNSILFGDNPPTQRSNGPLSLWQGTKSFLPPLVTGAWDEGKGDTRPVEHLYNLAFVRMPTVLMGIVYMRNLLTGHGLIMNFGDGLFEVPPLIVIGIILLILR